MIAFLARHVGRGRLSQPPNAEAWRGAKGHGRAAGLYGSLLAITLAAAALATSEPSYGQIGEWEAAMRQTQDALAAENAAEAEAALKRAIDLAKSGEASDQDLALSLSMLASLYHSQQRFTEAEALLREALPLTEATAGSDHPDVARMLSNLGLLCHERRDFEKAEDCYRRALEILEQSLGNDHVELILTLNNLAALDAALERDADAEAHYRRALAIADAHPGEVGRELTVALRGYGDLLTRLGRYQEARRLIRRAARLERGVANSDAGLLMLVVPVALVIVVTGIGLSALFRRGRGSQGEPAPGRDGVDVSADSAAIDAEG